MQQILTVSGMTCSHCVRAVTQAIQDIDPAATVNVDLQTGIVSVVSSAEKAAIEHAIAAEGYDIR